MLGDDDIGILIDEPITAADLFGEDEGENREIAPLSPNADFTEDAAGDGAAGEATAEGAPKKKKVDRLPNLNEKWITDPKKEGMYAVNKYFEHIKLKPGKGNELASLKTILRRYEYWAQQCYPKFCFTDVVNKLEYLSAKKPIKRALMDIRNKTNPFVDADADNDDDNIGVTNPVDPGIQDNSNVFPTMSPPITSVNSPSQAFDSFSSPQPAQSSSTPMGDDMRAIIRRKREEAIAKRKRKLDESLNSSSISLSQSDIVDGKLNDRGRDVESSLNSSAISMPETDNIDKKANSQDSELEPSLNSTLILVPPCENGDEKKNGPNVGEISSNLINCNEETVKDIDAHQSPDLPSISVPQSNDDEMTINQESNIEECSSSIPILQSDNVDEKTIDKESNGPQSNDDEMRINQGSNIEECSSSISILQSDNVDEKTIDEESNGPQSNDDEMTINQGSNIEECSSSISIPQSDNVDEKTIDEERNGISIDSETAMDTD